MTLRTSLLPLVASASLASTAPVHPGPAETAHPAEPPPSSAQAAPLPKAPAIPSKDDEISSLIRLGVSKTERGDFEAAELAFMGVLRDRATADQDREALTGLARMYRKKGDFTRAAAVYERALKEYPAGAQGPVLFLELGRTYRAMGAYKLAIARFYSVINSTLKMPEPGEESAGDYRQLARTAQYEIAETHFVSGAYTEANKFFSRLTLLDLTPEDRARAQFKAAYSLLLGEAYEDANTALRSFVEQNPDDENTPEARYLRAVTLRRLGKGREAFTETVEILRLEKERTARDPERWAYWQRKTGNQIANEFFEQGDFTSALSIYQSLAALSNQAPWRIPALYHVGLCLERLGQTSAARDTYQSIVNDTARTENAGPELDDVARMAAWRMDHLSWEKEARDRITTFFPPDKRPPRPD